MALKKTVLTPHGINVVDAYHRVEGVVLDGKNAIKFQIRSSVDGVLPHFSDVQHRCEYDIDGKNPIAQAYAYLKTLPEFTAATDC